MLLGGTAVAAVMLARRGQAQSELARLSEKLATREQQFAEQKQLIERVEERFADAFSAIGGKALRANNEQFLELAKRTFEKLLVEAKGDAEKKEQAIDGLVKPIKELLEKQNTAVQDIERKREVAYTGIEAQIKVIAESHEKLSSETGRLVSALRRPEQRGRWGELQLRNVVELAGMTEHCDFDEQASVQTENGLLRPDMVVHLPGEGVIVVDSKVALDAYLDTLQPDADLEATLSRHADLVEQHYKQLASKRYWDQFERTPKLVVMFMPLESALVAALDVKPDLHTQAMQNHVVIATPTLLVALLRAVAYGWQQDDVARNAREIASAGRELYGRLATFVAHFEKVGAAVDRGIKAYNDAIGSLERMILPSSRKLKELHATTDDAIESPRPVETEQRPVTAPELKPPDAPPPAHS